MILSLNKMKIFWKVPADDSESTEMLDQEISGTSCYRCKSAHLVHLRYLDSISLIVYAVVKSLCFKTMAQNLITMCSDKYLMWAIWLVKSKQLPLINAAGFVQGTPKFLAVLLWEKLSLSHLHCDEFSARGLIRVFVILQLSRWGQSLVPQEGHVPLGTKLIGTSARLLSWGQRKNVFAGANLQNCSFFFNEDQFWFISKQWQIGLDFLLGWTIL